jgi:dissimilatory sulfite reductase related protein
MATVEIARRELRRDPEGFLVDSGEWTPEIAEEIARESGIPELTPRRWQVVEFMRERYLETGTAPSIRALGKESGVPIKELYELFPKGPAKLAAKIGGIPKPRGCI